MKLDPKAVYMHNLARALQKLKEHAQAHRWFAQALSTDSEYKFASDARKHLRTIERKLKKTHGRLNVQSTPSGVTCTIKTADGKSESRVKAPFERWVLVGKVTISGRKQKYLNGSTSVDVGAGDTKTVKIRLEPAPVEGYLIVLADAAGAEVFLNGKRVGPAPLKNYVVTSGTYTVEVKTDGYKTFKKTIVVEPDATERVVARLELIDSGEPKAGDGDDGTLALVLVGGGSGVLVIGAILVGVAHSKIPDGLVPPGAEGDSLIVEINGLSVGGWVALGAGVVVLGVGIYLMVTADPAPAEGGTAQLKLPSVMPTLSVDDTGASAGAILRF